MSTPLGQFVRAKRDSVQPDALGLAQRGRRRSPGVRRADVAALAKISVEYLTRIEQGKDRNPSPGVIQALADALNLDAIEREHLNYLAKITGGACTAHRTPVPPQREVRSTVLETLRLLEPGLAAITNRLGDLLAFTGGFESVMRAIGVLDGDQPNLTRFVFTDPRARTSLPDWDQVADECAFDLWMGPSAGVSEWFSAEIALAAGPEFTRRMSRHLLPARALLRLRHPTGGELRFRREYLELPSPDAQQLLVLLPADDMTARSVDHLRSAAEPVI